MNEKPRPIWIELVLVSVPALIMVIFPPLIQEILDRKNRKKELKQKSTKETSDETK